MNREERIRAALAGQPVDHVPVGAWMHLSEFDQDPFPWQKQRLYLQRNMISIISK